MADAVAGLIFAVLAVVVHAYIVSAVVMRRSCIHALCSTNGDVALRSEQKGRAAQ